MNQMGQRSESSRQNTQAEPNMPRPWVQLSKKSEPSNSGLADKSEANSSPATRLQNKHDPKLYNSSLDWEEPDDWSWLNDDFP